MNFLPQQVSAATCSDIGKFSRSVSTQSDLEGIVVGVVEVVATYSL